MNKTVLVTGGAGYIGSHLVVELLNNNFSVIVYDNLTNSNPIVFDRISQITGKSISYINGDIRDRNLLRRIFKKFNINSIFHLAGLKSVAESQAFPLKYHSCNVYGSTILFEEMIRAGVFEIIFSSSATVYGNPGYGKYSESTPLSPINVYGQTKLIIENILHNLKNIQPNLRVALLRYFNPVGAHNSGLIGESPVGHPNNLMPIIAEVGLGYRKKLLVYGGNYSTFDGTALRDYIHVNDLVSGHLAALRYIQICDDVLTLNLGTGRPYSVLEMVKTFEKVSSTEIPYEIVNRRNGDLEKYYADPKLAREILGWEASYDLYKMCEDTWNWRKNNPKGYT